MFENLKLLNKLLVMILIPSLLIVGSLALVSGYVSYNNAVSVLSNEVDFAQTQSAKSFSQQIETYMSKVSEIPITQAKSSTLLAVSNGSLSYQYIEDTWSNILLNTPEILDLWFVNGHFYQDMTFIKDGQTVKNASTTSAADAAYNYFTQDFYTKAYDSQQFQIIAPYYDEELHYLMVSAVAPVFYPNGTIAGVIGTDITISNLVSLINSISVGQNGYAFLITNDGTILAHPNSSYDFTKQSSFTINKWATDINSNDLKTIGQKMVDGQSGIGSFNSFTVYYQNISLTGWSIGLVYPSSETPQSFTIMMTTTFVLAILGLIIIAVVVYGSSVSISRPLKNLVNISKQISDKDFRTESLSIDNERKDEIGNVYKSYIDMAKNLQTSIKRIVEISTTIASSSQEMASSSEEVNASSEEISSIAQQMAKGSQEQTGQITQVLKISQNLKMDFEDKIRNINQTSTFIENIANQVNMLALNASIEAARAGEYGRGFSVVADNIRKLADDSKSSVGNVQRTIETLKSSLSKSIDTLTLSIEKVASVAEETASGAEEASAATEEQAATMEELTATAQELAHIAGELESIFSQFKL